MKYYLVQSLRLGSRLSIERWTEPRTIALGSAVTWSDRSVLVALHVWMLHVGITWFHRGTP